MTQNEIALKILNMGKDGYKDDAEGFEKLSKANKLIEEHVTEQLRLYGVGGSLRFSEREVDFAYLCGVFNVSGIDGLHKEIQRLKELGKEPHDII